MTRIPDRRAQVNAVKRIAMGYNRPDPDCEAVRLLERAEFDGSDFRALVCDRERERFTPISIGPIFWSLAFILKAGRRRIGEIGSLDRSRSKSVRMWVACQTWFETPSADSEQNTILPERRNGTRSECADLEKW